jgi:hypothetical protein
VHCRVPRTSGCGIMDTHRADGTGPLDQTVSCTSCIVYIPLMSDSVMPPCYITLHLTLSHFRRDGIGKENGKNSRPCCGVEFGPGFGAIGVTSCHLSFRFGQHRFVQIMCASIIESSPNRPSSLPLFPPECAF